MDECAKSTVEVQREFAGITDNLRNYEVVIDGEVVGSLAPGQASMFDLASGEHEIVMKIDWARSDEISFSLSAGQTVRFRCAPRANVFTDLYWATLGRRRYIKLTRITD